MTSTLDKIKASAKDLTSTDPVLRGKAEEIKRRYQLGMFNHELEAEGAKPVPIKKPNFEAVDMSKVMEIPQEKGLSSEIPRDGTMKSALSNLSELGKDTPSDFREMGENVLNYGKEQTDRISTNIARREADGDMSLGETLMTALDYVGGTLGTASNTIFEGAKFVGKLAMTPEDEKKAEELIQTAGQGVSNVWPEGSRGRELAKQSIAAWEKLKTDKPEVAQALIDGGQIVSFLSDLWGGKVVNEVGKETLDATVDVIKKGGDVVIPAIKQGGEAVMSKIDDLSTANKARRVAEQEAKVDDAVARIIQGSPEDIATAKKTFMEVDTDGVKTYSDLNSRLDDSIETLAKKQDAELAKYTDVYTKDQLARYKEVKGIDGKMTTVSDAPIFDALNQLDAYYSKTGDVSKSTIVKQYVDKLNKEGLTVDEMNKIARMHGIDLNAYNANGELASGLTKQAAENTRQGVKETLRQRLPDEVSKGIDESLSNLYATRELTVKMEDKVQKLYQKIKNRTLAQKVGGAVADVVDLASFGTLRGFIQKLLPSNVGLKTANSLDLEAELAKNLKQIDKLLEIKDEAKFSEAVGKYLEEMQPGMSTRVVSGISAPDKDILLSKLQNVTSQDVIKKGELDLELFDRLETLKKQADIKSLTEREYAELKVLIDEVEENIQQAINPQ